MKKIYLLNIFWSLVYAPAVVSGQTNTGLTVEKIMSDQKWIGVAPTNLTWSSDSRSLFFDWNPERKVKNEIFEIGIGGSSFKPRKTEEESRDKAVGLDFGDVGKGGIRLGEKDGDLYLMEVKTGKIQQLTHTLERESKPVLLLNGDIAFQRGQDLFCLNRKTGILTQLSNFVKGKKPDKAEPEGEGNAQKSWLKADQTALFDVIRERNAEGEELKRSNAARQKPTEKEPRPIYLGNGFLSTVVVSPDGRFINYKLVISPKELQGTVVPNYVTSSGFTEEIEARTKVGDALPEYQSFIFDRVRDTVYVINTSTIPGIRQLPDYVKDYPKQLEERTKKNEDRKVNISGVKWNASGSLAVVLVEAQDNKDLWILKLDALTGALSLVDRQRDEAWIGGPGIGLWNVDWLDDNRIYFQSEASGYSHLYLADLRSGKKKQLTSGKWEVQQLQLSKDKRTFYFIANKEHPGITHFYKIGVEGGAPLRLTNMRGGNEVLLSPDEQWLAVRYSYMDKPWELYVQRNKAGAKAVQVTQSTSAEFNAYKWRQPELVLFRNRYGADVYARVYPAANPHPNHPAVVFVHGAGYLQNVHYWWSQYSREYMFNNLLADNGYTVIDIDYTASSGYGRDHRTGIYRHMGGKDLSDQVDGVKMLVERYQVNPKHVGLYGGSYGGFITLMALFNEPDVFASGAALRSVTDWAHYNHGYTSNILNEPYNDELSYKRSSPIYFASGLKGDLLMCHGMVDVNVHFQDIVRLSQRLIELGKNKWELAVYPVEDHGFVEPSSWTDEYKRIFKLFETTLKR
ncbi:dipeptidyl-peptidase [Pedobacter sp. BAL39]|uniref:S9 family peptidase n=1 Tax=Pedobacter sp. BAL39 TaxID=391596 RepID=UPI0001559B07|nr:prolyl oligopeptidase family serine peptidase [Pedobacter sp. BAL39]EDM36370.1 dipeptidyl-peptidase [Pedobacter sp. BAL39]